MTHVGADVRAQTVARVGSVRTQAPIHTGWTTPEGPPPDVNATLDQLSDVDAPPDVPGLIERQDTGRVTPVTRTEVIAAHVASLTPHPVYDDLPSLTLLFENGLV